MTWMGLYRNRPAMSNKTTARHWFEEVWNRKNPKAIYELMHPEAVGYTEGGSITGPERFEKDMFAPLIAALPDVLVTVESMIGEGDEVATRWTAVGTHTHELMGIPATHKKVSFSGVTWFRFRDGKLAEGWDRWNLHGLMTLLHQGVPSATAQWVE